MNNHLFYHIIFELNAFSKPQIRPLLMSFSQWSSPETASSLTWLVVSIAACQVPSRVCLAISLIVSDISTALTGLSFAASPLDKSIPCWVSSYVSSFSVSLPYTPILMSLFFHLYCYCYSHHLLLLLLLHYYLAWSFYFNLASTIMVLAGGPL